MTDLEITKACAEAICIQEIADCAYTTSGGFYFYTSHGLRHRYDPLHDDAQAMALVKKFKLNIGQVSNGCKVFTGRQRMPFVEADGQDLNRAICECVARMHKEKA